jgi:ABC-2 type transport system ATP-binding protein
VEDVQAATRDAMVRAEGLVKAYGRTRALDRLSLQVPRGSIYGFVGPNGAGKTTTMRILAGLLPPDGGQAWIAGRPLATDPAAARAQVGYMPDFFGVYDNLTVAEYLDFYAAANGVAAVQSRQVIADLLELVDLAHERDDFVEGLSRGMKQRLGLARCLVHDPAVLLLDEPASGMDPRARYELREVVKELRRIGKTVVISSHILRELSEMCTHIGIIQGGRLVREGSVEAVLSSLGTARLVRVRTLDVEAAAKVLSEQPGVGAVTQIAEELEVTFTGDDDATAGLVSALVLAGVRVVHFAAAQDALEEIFLQLTEPADAAD